MTAGPIAAASTGARPHTGWSLGQGLASLAVAVGAILTVALNDAGQGVLGIVLIALGVLALAVVESARVRSRIRWDRAHALEGVDAPDSLT